MERMGEEENLAGSSFSRMGEGSIVFGTKIVRGDFLP